MKKGNASKVGKVYKNSMNQNIFTDTLKIEKDNSLHRFLEERKRNRGDI